MTIGGIGRALIPGLGQIQAGRGGRGLLIFLLFAFFLNGYLIMPFVHDSPDLRFACLGLGIFFWLVSFVDVVRLGREEPDPAPPAPETTAHQVDADPAPQERHD